MKQYQQWIETHYPTSKEAMGQCKKGCEQLKATFPELKITNGFVAIFGDYVTHWWCVTQDGTIIDPTAVQFGVVLYYDEIDDDHPERLYEKKKCMNCGEYYYQTPDLRHMHTPACEAEFTDYLNGKG